MKIYIASSWKNEHGVTMLTSLLRADGHDVISWIENNYGENHNHVTKKMDFETWVNSSQSQQSFDFDTNGAKTSDLLIYYGPAGKDAAVELGIAYGANVPIIGLWAKGEDLGLMRKVVKLWFNTVNDLIKHLQSRNKNPYAVFGGAKPHPMDFDNEFEYKKRISNYLRYEEWKKQQSTDPFLEDIFE